MLRMSIDDLIFRLEGMWVARLLGPDMLALRNVPYQSAWILVINSDGSAVQETSCDGNDPPSTGCRKIKRSSWSVTSDFVLSIASIVPPMLEYGIETELLDESLYDILGISDCSLTLSDRPHDGETIYVMEKKS